MTNSEGRLRFLDHLDTARAEVREKFSRAHRILQEREDCLLNQLQEVEDSFILQQLQENKARDELLATKADLQVLLKGNENQEILFKMLAPLEDKLKRMENEGEIQIAWHKQLELENLLKQICTIKLIRKNSVITITEPMLDYSHKVKPVLTACKYRPHPTRLRDFKGPTAVAIHHPSSNIYVVDALNNRVQVFDMKCRFLFDFSENMNYPAGICFHDNKVYVTQFTGNVITVYHEDGTFLQSIGDVGDGILQFNSPLGICYSGSNNAIYVCERDNDRVQVFGHDMSFDSFIQGLTKPVDVKTSARELFILDRQNPCFHVYNFDHQLIREVVSLGDDTCQVSKPVHFCLDTLSNILLTDYSTCQVKIFTKDGNPIHKFGLKGTVEGCFKEPRGIALDLQGRIIVASQNPNHCIQFF